MSATALVGAVALGIAVATGAALVHPPRRRLAGRVRPYAAAALSALGRPVADVAVLTPQPGRRSVRSVLVALLRGGGDDPVLRMRLRQAGLYDVPDHLLVGEHRVRMLLAGLLGGGVALVAAVAGGLGTAGSLGLGAVGVVAGAARPHARVDRAVAQRRAALRAEVPPLCHLLAVRLRANGSVVAALSQTIVRSRGRLVEELAEALAQHRAGRRLDDALEVAAQGTADADAARVLRLLAGAIRHGLDAAPELLRLSREVRQAHLLQLRRDATGRRAAVLLPTIGLLAPLILLFLGAPLPGLVMSP